MRAFATLLLLICLPFMGGCSTLEGIGTDISNGYSSIASSFGDVFPDVNEQKRSLPVYDGTCPPVLVRPDLRTLVEFYNPAKASDATKVSEIAITGIRNTCRVENDALVMQIDLSFTGKTGPKARAKPADKPSFAYPYFVAVTDAQGMVVSKEIFAASVSYAESQTTLNQTESIFQSMPFPDPGAGKIYNVVVGFQLSDDQLAYNHTHMPVTAGSVQSH